MTNTDEFYTAMSKAIKDRDHAKGRVLWWQDKVALAESEIESLVATQHVDAADQPEAPSE
jgi:hypothetical protein